MPGKVRSGFPAGMAEKERVREFRNSEKSGNALAYPQACSPKPKAEAGGNPLRCVIFAIRPVEQVRERSSGKRDQPAVAAAPRPCLLKAFAVTRPSSAPASESRAAKAIEAISPPAAATHQGSQRSVTS